MATLCPADVPRIVTGTRGQYRVVEIPDVAHPFELTDDLKLAVVHFDSGFYLQSTSDGQRIGKPLAHPNSDWKVVGDRLIVANDNGWKVFSLPDFQQTSAMAAPPPLPGVTQSDAPVALARGWYCNGLFYDDAAEKILASCRIPSAQGWITGIENLQPYAADSPTSVMPFEILLKARHVVLHNYDRIPVPPPESSKSSARYGMRWMTLQGKASFTFGTACKHSGVYIELVDHDFSKFDVDSIQLVGWNTPSLRLDSSADFANWKRLVLPTDNTGDNKLLLHPRDNVPDNVLEIVSDQQAMLKVSPEAIRDGALDLQSSSLVNELQKASYAEIDEVIKRYLVAAVPEFELVTGQKPKNIPVAFTVQFENAGALKQVVWADMTQAEVLSRFGKAIWKRETNRRLDEHNQSILAHQQKIAQTNAANERMRAETIASKSEWLTNSIYVSLCVVFLAGSFGCIYFISSIRTREPQSGDQAQPGAEPPIVQPLIDPQ